MTNERPHKLVAMLSGRIRARFAAQDVDAALTRAEVAASLRLARAEDVGDTGETADALAMLARCAMMHAQTEEVPS